jgi:carboxymethylenebutenolidase
MDPMAAPKQTRMLTFVAVAAFTVLLTAWPLLAQRHADGPAPTTVQLTTPEGTLEAYVAYPPGEGRVPTMIVVHEWWGLGEQIKDVARRMAHQGYLTIVPDLYHGKVATTPEEAHELVRGLEDTRVFDELDAAAAWLKAHPRATAHRMGIMGFCVGGGLTLRYALRTPDLAAAVMYYGPPETDPAKLATLKAPLQGHFGAEDKGITTDRVDAFRAALKKSGKTADIYSYAGAGHAFMHDGNPSYQADAARIAWARTLAFLQRYLKG